MCFLLPNSCGFVFFSLIWLCHKLFKTIFNTSAMHFLRYSPEFIGRAFWHSPRNMSEEIIVHPLQKWPQECSWTSRLNPRIWSWWIRTLFVHEWLVLQVLFCDVYTLVDKLHLINISCPSSHNQTIWGSALPQTCFTKGASGEDIRSQKEYLKAATFGIVWV